MHTHSTSLPLHEPAPRRLSFAVALACLGMAAWLPASGQALPGGLQVVRGSAAVNTQGAAMTVTNSANAILNWQSFSIGNGAQVHFQQPGASSQVLNRVLGSDPSSILGSLTSNGRVWLLNPNGVIFGRDARVDVAGLVAGTLHMSDSDWLAGRYRLDAANPLSGAGVSNLGEIRTAAGGRVLLLSEGAVRNEGRIDAPGGQVALVSARQVELVDSARPNIAVMVNAPSGEVLNLGQLQAAGGRVDLQGAMVNQQGLVSADALGRGAAGEVLLQASGDTLVGGSVSARSEAGQGGDIRLLGRRVGIVGNAQIDASGATGGGQVLVGGGLQGRDPTVPNAEATFIGADTLITADATQAGDGGRVIVWGDRATRAYGTLLARGGPAGGNGGFIETSGGWLDAAPRQVSAAAPAGRAGQWLLDPNDIRIVDSATPDSNISSGPDFTSTGDSAQISTTTILAALDAGNDVTITTGNGAPNTQAGDITLDFVSLLPQGGAPVTLTLNAAHDIRFSDSSIIATASGAPVSVVLNAGTGTVSLTRSSIVTGGGNVGIAAPALVLNDSSIDAEAGRIGVRADSVSLLAGFLGSLAGGDAIVLEGFSGRFMTSFSADPDSNLGIDAGRWLAYAENVAAFDTGISNVSYSFVQYGDTTVQDTVNNGVVYNLAPTITLTGSASKVYDGNVFIALDGAGLSVVGGQINGDTVTVVSNPSDLFGNFGDANAGTGKQIAVNSGALSATDPLGRTVFGYAAITTGDVTQRPLSLAVSASDKVYDGGLATLASGSVIGLVGSETLVVNASGLFADPNVGSAKPVTVSASLADGSNGGLAANYVLSSNTAVTSASITPRSLTLSASAADKVYDGSSAAVASAGVTGLVGSETLVVNTSAGFDDPNVGTAKPVTVIAGLADGSNGGLASNYVLASNTATTTASITPRSLTLSASAADKVYDGSTAAVASASVSGLVGSETLLVNASGSFADANAATGKPVTVSATLADGASGGLAANYTLASSTATTTASITPRPLTLSVSAADKVYDGTSAAAASASVSGLVGSETLVVSASGGFDDRNVGTAKPVTVSASLADGSNGGLAANYTLPSSSAVTSASITPATLSYVATPAQIFTGMPLPALSGSVEGFVGGDTLSSATSGQLAFGSSASGDLLPGRYAVLGSGLSAANYVFVQDPANDHALTVLSQPPTGNDTQAALAIATDRVAPPPAPPGTVAAAPVLDVTQASRPRPSGQGISFQPLPLAGMSEPEVSRVLMAREDYKRGVFAGALAQLAKDPGLADLPACESAEQLQSGRCLLTESLKRQIQAKGGAAVAQAAPAPQAGAAPPSPAAVPAAPAAASPAPAPAPAAAPTTLALLTSVRPVRSATLPQIQRKLALVVGVDRYVDSRIPQLENAVRDARAIARTLESSLGYETLVLADADKETMVATLNLLALQVRPQDSVVVYYAGHGELVPSTGLGYWQLSSSRADDPRGWVSNSDIGKLLGLMGASQVALISDSCYSGSLVAGERIRPSAAGDAQALLSRKAAVAMSSGGNEPVADEGRDGHSPFAWNLMQQLGALPAWQPGGNVFERVRFAVARELPQRPQYGAAPQAGHQSGADYVFERRQLAGQP